MFNPPPADLNDREPLIHEAAPSEIWYRTYREKPRFSLVQRERTAGTLRTETLASSTLVEMNTAPSWSPSDEVR
jgi:hypothetical protein